MKKLNFLIVCFLALLFLPGQASAQQSYTAKIRQELKECKEQHKRNALKNARGGKAPQVKKRTSAGTTIYGCVLDSYGDYWDAPGIFSFSTASPDAFTQAMPGITVYGGGTIADGKYYAVYYKEEGSYIYFPVRLTVYDTNTWTAEKEYASAAFTSIATDLAYDHMTKRIYGCFQNADYSAAKTFGYLVFNENDGTYDSERIGDLPERMTALTVGADGTVYAISESGKFYTVDKSTGKATLVGDTGAGTTQWGYQSMCYDNTTGKIYWAGQNEETNNCLFEVDPSTGKATQLIDYWNDTETYDQIVGMFIKQEFESVTVPNPATDLSAVFTDASLTGELNFNLPTQDNTGNALKGKLQYSVTVNEQTVKTGGGEPGGRITESITVPASGMYAIAVTVTADGIESEKALMEKYIGYDSPQAPTEVKASAGKEMPDGGTEVTVSWASPDAGEHGGYVDLQNMTYNVTRQPDGVPVGTGLTSTSFTDKVFTETRTEYHYEIVASAGEMRSRPATSNKVTVGNTATCPFSETFDTEESFGYFSVVDANRDGSTWKWEDGYASYKYNQKNAANDWLMTPAFKMRANRLYVLQFTAMNSYPTERVAAYAGNSATAEAMTTEVVAPTEITYDERTKTLWGTFMPQADGIYHFGIKAMSDADMSTLYVDNITVDETTASVPTAVTDLTVKAGDKGALQATVSFTAPVECIDGTDIKELSIQIIRDGATVKELTDIEKGQTCSFEDKDMTEGLHTYTILPLNETGTGNKAEAKVYVGIDIPGKVCNLKAIEDINEEGTVILTWDAPETGQNGGYVDPGQITYYISKGTSGQQDINNGKSTTFRDKLDISKGQTYEGYSVYAVNVKGSGKNVWQTVVAIAGPAVDAPMTESLSGMKMKSGPWVTEMTNGEIGEAYWYPMDGAYQKSGCQDNDGGLWVFETTSIGKSSRMMSPKVDISKLDNPEVSFWVYNTGKRDKLDISVSQDFGDYESLGSITLEGEKGWQRYSFDLTAYKTSRFVRIGFTGTSVESTAEAISLDNVAITEKAECNLQLTDMVQPEKTYVGKPAIFSATIRNSGSGDITSGQYTVELYKNGKLTAQATGEDIKPGALLTVSVEDTPAVNDNESNAYYMHINCPDDKYNTDNTSETVNVELVFNEYPTPTNVYARQTGCDVELKWQEPDMSKTGAKAVTESFEDYDQFSISGFGEWLTVDKDGQNTIRITLGEGFGTLEYPHAGEPMAFQVFNSIEAGIPFTSWTPHTGDQMLVAFKCASPDQGHTEVHNDDWLISPELNGDAQTISFYAKAGMSAAYQPEKFQVLYSETSTDINSFRQIGETAELYNVSNWEEFRFNLPAGAKYFAIRCVSEAKFAMLLDDITYIPAGAEREELALTGYNIYRNDVRINSSPVTTTEFTDTETENGLDYTYHVTAVYDKGESRYSEACLIHTTGIGTTVSDDISMSVTDGGIHISGAENMRINVFNASGVRLFSEVISGQATIRLQPGMYIINTGSISKKIMVK